MTLITYSVVADLNKRFLTKHLGEVRLYMGSEYKRDRVKGTQVNSHTQFVRNVVERIGITKNQPHTRFSEIGPQAREG